MIRLRHGSAREGAHAFFDLCKQQVKQAGLDPDKTFYVYPIGGFGEFTFICSLLPALRAEGPVALFLPEGKVDYFGIFPQAADFVVHYAPMFAPYLPELYHIGMRRPGYPFVPFTDWLGDGRFNMELVTKEGRLTLKEGYAYVMGLPLTSPGVRATIPSGDRLPELQGPGKRVLVIPHANSHKAFDPVLWQQVTEQFTAAGYGVYFDTFNYHSEPPAGVVPLSLKPLELLRNLGGFDAVVALRSGLTDLLGTVDPAQRGKLAVVYHVTETPPAEEQRFNHARGVARSGLALTRIFPGDATIRDIEIDGDRLDPAEIAGIVEFVTEPSSAPAGGQA